MLMWWWVVYVKTWVVRSTYAYLSFIVLYGSVRTWESIMNDQCDKNDYSNFSALTSSSSLKMNRHPVNFCWPLSNWKYYYKNYWHVYFSVSLALSLHEIEFSTVKIIIRVLIRNVDPQCMFVKLSPNER